MVGLADLWLPIVLSGVAVFIVSSIIHMVVKWHMGDYGKLPDEDAVMTAMRDSGLQPGQYLFPRPDDPKDWQSPEMKERYEKGPVGFLSVLPNGMPAMGKNLLLWFVYSILVGVFVGYITGLSQAAGAHYGEVFRVAGTVAILAYALPNMVDSIWKGIRWAVTLRFIADGVAYGLVTAGVFGWLWPAA
jgi:hypothetical protein